MKTPEEIKSLAETTFQEELIKSNQNINWIGYGKGIDGISKEKWIELWIKGYTQCQQDNVEEMKMIMEALLKIRDCKDYGNNSSTLARELLQSLNKQDK